MMMMIIIIFIIVIVYYFCCYFPFQIAKSQLPLFLHGQTKFKHLENID